MSLLTAYTHALSTGHPHPAGGDRPHTPLSYGGDGHAVYASVDMWTQALGQQTRRESPHGYVLEHTRRLRHLYGGLRYTTLHHLSQRAAQIPGSWSRNLIALLEQRLDMVVCRAWWCRGPRQARLYIRRGMVHVNGVAVYRSSYQLSPGDVVSIAPPYRDMVQRHCLDMWKTHHTPMESPSGVTTSPQTSVVSGGTGVSAYDILSRARQHGYCTPIPGTHLVSVTRDHAPTRQHTSPGMWQHMARRVCKELLGDDYLVEALWPMVRADVVQSFTPLLEGAPIYASPHIEVHYGTMRLVYLYTPQYITWPCLVDVEALRAHL